MKSVLVTGGAGFIGSALAKRFQAEGYDVVVVDNLVTGFDANVPSACHLVEGDLADHDTLGRVPERDYAACCHLAAQSSGEISFENPGRDLRSNALGTVNVLQWCRTQGVGKVVFASSMSVYGDQPLDTPVEESAVCVPKSFYGISKLTSEHLLRLYKNEYDLEFAAFRLFNVYGPGQNLSNLKQGMVSIYLKYLLDGKTIPVKGSLDRFRDLIYIDDVVSTLFQAATTKSFDGHVVNLGTGVKTDVRTLLQKLCDCFGLQDYSAVVKVESGTPGDQFGIYASVAKLKSAGDGMAYTSLDDGLRSMVEWARKVGGQQ